ncbi:MAG: hypothetical protein HOQ02_01170 [Lysobacter sp.]|nr:hypothetical protein [Lysobacter sp.]
MPWFDEAWLRRAFEALKETLDADPRLKRDMIQFLLDEGFWDTEKLKWDSAVARFNGCLNPNKDDFFKLGEAWALMKRFGRHQLFLAMAEDLGYEVRRRPTEERRQELLERIAVAAEKCERTMAEVHGDLARLEGPVSTAASIPTQGNGQRMQFSKDGSRREVP